LASAYHLLKWEKEKHLNDILLMSLYLFFAILTRYDGWFQFAFTGLILFLIEVKTYLSRRLGNVKTIELKNFVSNTIGKLSLFMTLSGLGIALWIVWNAFIFKDPFYFALGQYSAHAQQELIEKAGGLYAKKDLVMAVLTYGWSLVDNFGFFFTLFTIFGFYIYLRKKDFVNNLSLLVLMTPMIFNIVSLYQGYSTINVPELVLDPYLGTTAGIFNVRYGLMMLPAISVYISYLISKSKFMKYFTVLLIIIQPIMLIKENYVITLKDGLIGSSASNTRVVSDWAKVNMNNNDELIMLSMVNSSLAFDMGFPLKRYIHEGTGRYWETSIIDPSIYATWLILPKGNEYNPMYIKLVKDGNSKFLRTFDEVKEFDDLIIYKRKEHPRDTIYAKNGELWLNDKKFKFIGVNSYDLIYKSPADISATLSSAKDNGIKVVRFWIFGEGFEGAIQPEPGVYNEDRLAAIDYIFAVADRLDMKVIPVFANYWEAYGGVDKYLEWDGIKSVEAIDKDKFFDSQKSKNIYKNFVFKILTRSNSLSAVAYKDDPVVFAWELMNEPRSSSVAASDKVVGWIDEMSKFVRSIDPSHLILTGSEGFLTDNELMPYATGPMIDDLDNLAEISVMTAHYYLDNVKSERSLIDHEVVARWDNFSDSASIPLLIEEVGFSKKPEDNGGIDRYTLYESLLKQAKAKEVDGILLWNWSLSSDDNFGISPIDLGDARLIELIKSYSEEISK